LSSDYLIFFEGKKSPISKAYRARVKEGMILGLGWGRWVCESGEVNKLL